MNNNIRCLVAACDELEVLYEFLDEEQNVVRVGELPNAHYFVHGVTPFNPTSITRLCNDKYYTYRLLRDVIRTPRTVSYLDPFVSEKYKEYVQFTSYEEIVEDIQKQFELPIILKRNRGSLGDNVFISNTAEEVQSQVRTIFNKDSKSYDYVALAQEKVNIQHEYRAMALDGNIEVVYERDNSNATFVGNLSPLFWEGAQAVHITDSQVLKRLQDFATPIFSQMVLRWTGLDIALDTEDRLWLLEVNAGFAINNFLKDNDKKPLVEMYKKAIETLFT